MADDEYEHIEETDEERKTHSRWIDWTKCLTRQIILDDLTSGLIPMDTSAEDAWNGWYKELAEVKVDGVVFSQFKARFADHKKQVNGKKKQSAVEEKAFERHCCLKPRSTHNERGDPIWDTHPAKLLLRDDVKDKKHKSMTPSALHETRPEYKQFRLKTFAGHIHQEVRYQKFQFYLELKRAEKQREERGREAALFNQLNDLTLNDN